MLQDRHIAFFIDVDNVALSSDDYSNIIEQLNGMGTILLGKIYGAGERKHKEIYDDAEAHGYRLERPMRNKRRGRKDFDSRIFVDVVDAVNKAPAIDAVCIVAEPCDMVYLYSYLHGRGIINIALDNLDENSSQLVDEFVDLGRIVHLKFAQPKQQAKPVRELVFEGDPIVNLADQLNSDQPVETNQLLREIEHLKNLVDANSKQSEADNRPAETVADETHEPQFIPPVMEKVEVAPTPAVTSTPQNDNDLIRRIEEIRKSDDGGDTDDLIDEIRKMLDGM